MCTSLLFYLSRKWRPVLPATESQRSSSQGKRRALAGPWTHCGSRQSRPDPGEPVEGGPKQEEPQTEKVAASESRGGGASRSLLQGNMESPKYLPSQRNSQSRVRTTRWGTAGSEWSGCARPSPWQVPHTPHTWRGPEHRYSAQLKGWPRMKPLLLHAFSPYLQPISSLDLIQLHVYQTDNVPTACALLGVISCLCIKILNSKIHPTYTCALTICFVGGGKWERHAVTVAISQRGQDYGIFRFLFCVSLFEQWACISANTINAR